MLAQSEIVQVLEFLVRNNILFALIIGGFVLACIAVWRAAGAGKLALQRVAFITGIAVVVVATVVWLTADWLVHVDVTKQRTISHKITDEGEYVISLPQYTGGHLISVRVFGGEYDWRKILVCAHAGYAGQTLAVKELTVLRDLDSQQVGEWKAEMMESGSLKIMFPANFRRVPPHRWIQCTITPLGPFNH